MQPLHVGVFGTFKATTNRLLNEMSPKLEKNVFDVFDL